MAKNTKSASDAATETNAGVSPEQQHINDANANFQKKLDGELSEETGLRDDEEIDPATGEIIVKNSMQVLETGNEDKGTSVPTPSVSVFTKMRENLQSLQTRKDEEMLNTNASYLDLVFGASYNASFTGLTVQIPNKVERKKYERSNGTEGDANALLDATCLFLINPDKTISAHINSDSVIMRQVAEWRNQGLFNNGNTVERRMKIGSALQENPNTGFKFKPVEFYL